MAKPKPSESPTVIGLILLILGGVITFLAAKPGGYCGLSENRRSVARIKPLSDYRFGSSGSGR
ncbi:hypothetical protein BJ994_000662 [Arthrobacter pigmenti]|uniref:Uncharacterized protein n=1 Tax=Arthrobacter pigmenti TaxID=271432 RepID=A0A846RR76_9MICC|nr:hypothetical protein [Arthrobacter pigmenti]